MRYLTSALFVATAALCTLAPLHAQTPAPKAKAPAGRASPHETVGTVLGERGSGTRVTLVYGRPNAVKAGTTEVRKIWGELVPYGKIWRLGSDEATLLITQKDLVIGDTSLTAGAYSLYLQPESDGSAKLIVNKSIGQWGIDPYPEATEVARIPLTKTTLETNVPQFTMGIRKDGPLVGTLRLAWETTEYSVGLKIKQ